MRPVLFHNEVAVIGSSGLTKINNLGLYLPEGTTEIISGVQIVLTR